MRLRLFLCCSTALLFAAGCNCDRPDPTDGGVTDGDVPPDGFVPPDGDRPPATMFTPPTITECGDLAPAAAGRCEVTAGDMTTLVQGDILTPGEVFRGGGVLIGADGRISCVGCDCVSMAGAATQVRCPDVVVSAGLINAHDHITFDNANPYGADGRMTEERYEHRHDWRTNQPSPPHTSVSSGGGRSTTGEMQFVELRQLMSGTTSIFASGGPAGLLRNLDNDTRNGLGAEANYETFPLGDSDETTFTDSCGYAYCRRGCDTSGVAADHAFVPHVAEGINEEARNEFRCMREGMRDFVQPTAAFIHGVGLLPVDMTEMAAENVELIWSPRTNITLYGDTARVSEYAIAGVTIGLGTDWIRSGSMNMLRELFCADSFNVNHLGGFFPEDQIWRMATVNNAVAFSFDDQIGVIANGRFADLALYDASMSQDYRAVLGARPQDVVLVMRAGEVLYGDDAIVDALRTGCDPVTGPGFTDVCGSPKRACLQELATTFSDLYAEANRREMAYPLFFCGEPTGEPSCLPARTMTARPDASVNGSGYYTGMSSAADMDGDGIENDMDNCPTIFNPVRPLDNGIQADSNANGVGDACDGVGGTVDNMDRDGDMILNDVDNCPTVANTDQSDRDMDMIGDVCDACPDIAVTAGTQTVYAVRCGATSGMVTLNDMVVTGITSRGFYAQQLEGSTDYAGVDFSGVFAFFGAPPTVARGDVVNLTGMAGDFGGLAQISSPAIVTTAMGMEPAPLTVTAAEIATGGARAEALESVLVRVEDVTVAMIDLGFGEFSVNDSLRIDDEMFAITPPVSVGQVFQYIQGPLNFGFENTKVEPRDISDVGFGALQISPASVVTNPSAMVTIMVVIPMDAPAGGADVTITPAPADILAGPAMITVPEGMRAASAMFTASATEQTGTVTASYGGEMSVATVSVSTAPVLFFSEYVEGTGTNKALELFNAGGGMADLSVCQIRRYTNGSSTPSAMFTLSGTLAGGAVHVVCGGIDMAAACDEMSGVINHNGDDAYDLFCAGMVVDTFGQIGVDPGDAWMGGGLGTQDFVLTRICSTTTGDTNGSDAFDPSTEWTGTAWSTAAASLTGLGNRDECP